VFRRILESSISVEAIWRQNLSDDSLNTVPTYSVANLRSILYIYTHYEDNKTGKGGEGNNKWGFSSTIQLFQRRRWIA